MDAFLVGLAHVSLTVLFLLLATAAWVSVVFQLPGNWIVVGLSALYGWIEGFRAVAWWVLFLGIALAATGELLEWVTGYCGTRRFGGRRAAGVAAILGSIVGAIVGASFLWGLGAVPGTILGAFAGALFAELLLRRRAGEAARAGIGAAAGRALGLSAKLGLGAAFLSVLLVRVVWVAVGGP